LLNDVKQSPSRMISLQKQ